MEHLKGLILSGGAGTRLRPITHTSAKQLVPVANKPVLFYGIEALVEAGVEEIGIIDRPRDRRRDRAAAGDGSAFGASITYIAPGRAARPRARGAHRRGVPRRTSRSSCTSATTCCATASPTWSTPFATSQPDALILLTRVPDPGNYGVAELDGEQRRAPGREAEGPPSDLALVGVYMFGPSIFEAAQGDRALGSRRARDHRRHPMADRRRQAGREPHGQRLVEGHRPARRHARGEPARARGPRAPRRGRAGRLEGRGAGGDRGRRTARALGGPRPGDHRRRTRGSATPTSAPTPRSTPGSRSSRAEVEHSILLAGSSVSDLDSRMEASLLGRNVRLSRGDALPKTLRMIVGDNSEIKIP